VEEAQTLAYKYVLLSFELIEQPFSPFQHGISSLVTLTLASPTLSPPPEQIGRPRPKHRRWQASPCWRVLCIRGSAPLLLPPLRLGSCAAAPPLLPFVARCPPYPELPRRPARCLGPDLYSVRSLASSRRAVHPRADTGAVAFTNLASMLWILLARTDWTRGCLARPSSRRSSSRSCCSSSADISGALSISLVPSRSSPSRPPHQTGPVRMSRPTASAPRPSAANHPTSGPTCSQALDLAQVRPDL
jgi:hypothetical protein